MAAKKKSKETKQPFLYTFNSEQKEAVKSLYHHKITILRGKAGVGKTFLAVAIGLRMLAEGKVKQLILVRPMVATEEIGHLPGTAYEKYEPHLFAVIEFVEKFGETFVDRMKDETIIPIPIAFLRGVTFSDSYVCIDESQNITVKQMKLVISRLGKGSKIVFTGDLSQCDIEGESGLERVVRLAQLDMCKKHIVDIELFQNERDECLTDILNAWDWIEESDRKSKKR